MSNVIAVPIVDFDDKSYVSVQSLSHSSWARLKQVDFALTDPDRKTFAGQKVWVDMDTKTIVGPQHEVAKTLLKIGTHDLVQLDRNGRIIIVHDTIKTLCI